MPDWLKILYACYLGKDKGRRLCRICEFLKDHDGKSFFDTYSTHNDSIRDFIIKCEKAGARLI